MTKLRDSYLPILRKGAQAIFVRHHLFSAMEHLPKVRCDETRERLLLAQWYGMTNEEKLPYVLAARAQEGLSLEELQKAAREELESLSLKESKAGKSTGLTSSKVSLPATSAQASELQPSKSYQAFVEVQKRILRLSRTGTCGENRDVTDMWTYYDLARAMSNDVLKKSPTSGDKSLVKTTQKLTEGITRGRVRRGRKVRTQDTDPSYFLPATVKMRPTTGSRNIHSVFNPAMGFMPGMTPPMKADDSELTESIDLAEIKSMW
eukprot:CAMPEP_0201504486 /NCGR_PEP_ID=MMETSP0151_2-20130828/85232_1 /ASSEMBLY_ACC=CAM_ASM_000257 /TAXON_ID=200890 /ORGANISM="Paramoeba atlantica, Strain 621/1 / CCAP 1560/9" /LENGTH=262 /DNA_ID=CAMNT_0047898231 /DNA_START=58 /DNA_END=843 /DNA_ORIENTATION=+